MVDALIDMRCGQTLVKWVAGPFISDTLKMRCINRDMREYLTKWAELNIGKQLFYCKVGVVPRLDSPVLIGCD